MRINMPGAGITIVSTKKQGPQACYNLLSETDINQLYKKKFSDITNETSAMDKGYSL